MAITAKFEADFSSFQAAVEQAEVTLRSFDGSASTVEKSLNRMVNNFSGTKVIQDATLMAEAVDRVGGTSKLTANELATVSAKAQEAAAKLRAMGQDVPEKIQSIATAGHEAGGALSTLSNVVTGLGNSFVAHVTEGILLRDAIREVITVAKEAITDAAKIEDLSKATGISTDALQRMGYIGVEAGLDMDQMGRAIEQLSAKLAGGDKSASEAVKSLGLSVKDLIAEGPQNAFVDITDAVGKVEDPMQRAALATELFGGRLGKQLLPLMGELKDKMEAVPQSAIISEENIKKAKEFDDGLKHLETQLKATTVALLGYLSSRTNAGTTAGAKALADADQEGQAAANFEVMFQQLPKMIADAKLPEKFRAATFELQNLDTTTKDGAANMAVLQAEIKTLDDEIQTNIELNKKAAEATAKWMEAFANLFPFITSSAWDGTTESLLRLGGSVNDVATYMGEWKGTVLLAKQANDELDAEVKQLTESMAQGANNLGVFADKNREIHTVLTNLAVQMGDVTLGSRGFNTVVGLMPDLTDAASRHMAELTDRSKDWDRELNSLSRSLSLLARVSDGTFGDIVHGASEATRAFSDLSRSKQDFDNADSKSGKFTAGADMVANAISIGATIFNILKNIGGPSKDELAARDTFASFQKQFGSLQQTIAGVGTAYKAMGKTGTEAQRDLQAAFDATHASAEAERSALDKINGVLEAQKKFIQDVTQAGAGIIGQFNAVVTGAAKDSKEELGSLGTQAVASFTAAVASGQSMSAALAAIHPSLQTLADSYKKLGLNVDDVALKSLLMRDAIVTANPDLINAIGGLTGEMDALNTMGLLNTKTLQAMEVTGSQTYNALLKSVKELGGTDAEALGQFQDFLHNAADAAKKLGIPLDDNTQALIDQSKQAGIWQDAITPQDKLLKGMQDLVDKVQDLVNKLNGIPSSISTTVKVGWDVQQPPDFSRLVGGTGIDVSAGIEHFATGGVVGADNRMIAAADGEMVLTTSQQKNLLGLASGGGSAADWRQMSDEIKALRQEQRRMPDQISAALTSALLLAKVGRR